MENRQPAIAYIRVSSRAQNYATQRSAIENAVAARGDIISEWYAEKKSAKTIDRPELDRVRADARAGRLRGRRLYVFRLDRISRSGIRDTLAVLEELRVAGCEVVSVTDGFDLSGPAAEVVISVMAWAAQMELMAKNERIAAARERVEAEGRSWGRPRRMDDRTIQRALTMRNAGSTIRQIAMALKVPKSTVSRTLTSHKLPSSQQEQSRPTSVSADTNPPVSNKFTSGPSQSESSL